MPSRLSMTASSWICRCEGPLCIYTRTAPQYQGSAHDTSVLTVHPACVRHQSIPDSTNAGILLPTTFMNEFDDAEFLLPECRAGTVVALGPGRLAPDGVTRIAMPDIQVGQKVIVGPAKGERVELYGQSLQESTHFLFTPEEVRERHATLILNNKLRPGVLS